MPTTPRNRGPVTRREYEALAAFRATLRRFLAFSEAAAKGAGLTPRQHQALLAVKAAPSAARLGIGDLAGQLQVRHHSAVGLVDRLVALGLLKRASLGVDRRRVQLVLTAKGSRTLDALTSAHRDELRQVAPRFEGLLAELGLRSR